MQRICVWIVDTDVVELQFVDAMVVDLRIVCVEVVDVRITVVDAVAACVQVSGRAPVTSFRGCCWYGVCVRTVWRSV